MEKYSRHTNWLVLPETKNNLSYFLYIFFLLVSFCVAQVLSVCSPYFQKIFLDHPSQHPILFMTDVNSNHMAGLLDFMYSGQVNVKYEDLPKFLKVAEIMQIKGLHTEVSQRFEFQPKFSES